MRPSYEPRPAQAKMIAERERIGMKTELCRIGRLEVDTSARPCITRDCQAEIEVLKPGSVDSIKSGEARGTDRTGRHLIRPCTPGVASN